MKDELFERIVMYKATMSQVKSMLAEGLISEEEYSEIDRIFAIHQVLIQIGWKNTDSQTSSTGGDLRRYISPVSFS